MKKFEMPMLSVERFEVTDCVTLSGFNFFAAGDSSVKGSFEYFTSYTGENDTRLG